MRNFALIVLLSALAGCTIPQEPPLSADEQNALDPVECKGAQQCGAMWQRAQVWVVNNAGYKIQIANDAVIQTFNPIQPSVALAFTVTKEPKGNDVFEINSRAGCANQFVCRPLPNRARAALHRYLRQTPQ